MSLITVNQGIVTEYHGDGVPAFARLYANRDFISSNNSSEAVIVERGSHSKPNYYQEFPVTMDGDNVIIAQGDVYTTTDSNKPTATYRLELYDTEGNRLKARTLDRLRVPPTPNPTTWLDLALFSGTQPADLPDTFYTAAEMNALLNLRLLNNDPILTRAATTAVRGHVVFNSPPDDPAQPKVLGPNDPLLAGINADTEVFRSSHPNFDAAATAGIGKELVTNVVDVLTTSKTLSRFIKTSVRGDGKWSVPVGHGLTIANLLDPGDRKLNIGDGKLKLDGGMPFMRMAWWTGPFGGTTTLNGAINSSVTAFTLADASKYGPAPFHIALDKEIIHVTTVAGNNVTACIRGFDGTAAAAHSNGVAVYPAITSKMIEGMLESAASTNGNTLLALPGTWAMRGNLWDMVSGLTIKGSGGVPDAGGGTVFRLLTDNSHIIKIGEGKRHMYFEDISFDCSGVTGGTGVRMSGLNVAAPATLNVGFSRCKWFRGDYGFHAYDETGSAWLALNLTFDQCEFNYQDIACYKSGTVNASWLFKQCNFSPGATTGVVGDAVAAWHNYCGPVTHLNCTYNGQTPISPQTWHTNISAIDLATNKITTVANHHCTVNELAKVTIYNAAGASNLPFGTKNINARSTTSTEAIDISETEIDVADGAFANKTVPFSIIVDSEEMLVTAANGATDKLTVVRGYNSTVAATHANGVTMYYKDEVVNLDRMELYFKAISATEGYCYLNPHTAFLGDESNYRYNFVTPGSGTHQLRTPIPIREGKPKAVFLIENTITPVILINCQDESFPYFAIIRNQYELQKGLSIKSSIIQAPIRCETSCIISSEDNILLANTFQDVHTNTGSVAAVVHSKNDQIVYDGVLGGYKDQGNTVFHSERVSLNGFCSFSKLQTESVPDQGVLKYIAPNRVIIDKAFASSNLPAFEITRDRNIDQKSWLRIGLKEIYEPYAMSRYYDWAYLDKEIFGGIQFDWMDDWIEWKTSNANVASQKDGRFLSGHIAYRGRRINVHSQELVSSSNVTTLDASLGEFYYFNSLTENTTINRDGTAGKEVRPYEEKTIEIPVSATSRFVTWGDGFFKPAPGGFHTGTNGSHWIFKFAGIGGNQLKEVSRRLVGTDMETTPPATPGEYRFPGATTPQVLVPNTAYLTNNGGPQRFILPASANVGDRFGPITAHEDGGAFKIEQNANQQIIVNSGGSVGTDETTVGAGGFIESNVTTCTVELVYSAANKFTVTRCHPTTAALDVT